MKSMKPKFLEVDLYKPIQRYFVKQGYEVHGEVNHCDLAAIKDNELIIVELKRNLTVDLLVQATKRQRLTAQVYIAVPKPAYNLFSKKWQDLCYLIRRLELGLILVSFQKNGARMQIHFDPAPFDRARSIQLNKKRKDLLLKEVEGRTGNYNVGGSSKTKIMTSYKEKCIQIACLLERFGPLTPKSLREMGTGEKTLSILSKNYYGWFDKVKRGTYAISEKGKKELEAFSELVTHYRNSYIME